MATTKKLTTLEHVKSGATYIGSSAALATAIVGILLFFVPSLEAIAAHLTSVVTVIINLILIVVFPHDN